MLGMAMIMAIFVAPLQIFIGDLHGLNTFKHQPAKVAAMEGAYETESNAPLRLFGIPNEKEERIDYSLEVPALASLILTHSKDGVVRGLKEWAPEDRPPVTIVFFAFRIMVAIGMLMALTGAIGAYLYLRKRLFDNRPFQVWCMAMMPSGFIAVLSGWFVTEVGRQPWVAYGILRTVDAASPVLGSHVAVSLLAFIIVYTFVFGAGTLYILRLIGQGPLAPIEGYREHDTVATPFIDPTEQNKGA